MFSPNALRRLIRFAATGMLVTVLHVLVALILIYGFSVPPGAANAAAFALATGASYLINTIWSFQAALTGLTLVRFAAVSCVGLALSWAIGHLADGAGLSPILGIACVAVIVPGFSFTAHHLWTFGVAGPTKH